jgi:hypothetical protein
MHMRMEIYSRAAVERAMKLQEVLLRATAGKIKWWQAAEMIGMGLASNLGPLVAVNSGPSVAACWTR